MRDHSSHPGQHRPEGCEICEITPVILGGSPNNPANKVILTRKQHFEYVRYWNLMIRDLRGKLQ